ESPAQLGQMQSDALQSLEQPMQRHCEAFAGSQVKSGGWPSRLQLAGPPPAPLLLLEVGPLVAVEVGPIELPVEAPPVPPLRQAPSASCAPSQPLNCAMPVGPQDTAAATSQ